MRNASRAPRGAFCSICPSVTLSLHSPTSEALFFSYALQCRDGPAVQVTGKVKSKRHPPGLQHLHLQISLYLVSTGGLCVYILSTSGTTQLLVAVDLFTLVKRHGMLLIKKHYKCNKHESVFCINSLRQNRPSKFTKTAFGAVLRWICTD